MNKNISDLLNSVVNNDYCIGCGVCASLNGSPLTMKIDEDGKFKPFINESIKQTDKMKVNVLHICPFSNDSKNETEIGKEVFGQFITTSFNEYTGYHIKNYAGYVKEGEYRKRGSSGGMGTWIPAQLLKNNLVDGIIHVKATDPNSSNMLFEYQVSISEEDLSKGAKSKYYPIEMSQVIKFIKENKGRYALVGIPCYIKSIRLLADQDEVIKERIKYYIGLVCGHLKSDLFAKSIGWQLGIHPDNIKSIDFRKKLKGRKANDYGVEVYGYEDGNEKIVSSPTKELFTTNWGHGLFKYKACEFCDDVLAETADVTVGDAWLPEYSKDSMGTNVIIIRNPDILNLFKEHEEKINIEEISIEKVYQSQAGGFRHRKDGLAYRLYLKDKNNEWRPIKRVYPSNKMSFKRKQLYEKRTHLSQESFRVFRAAKKEGDFNAFIKYMDPLIQEYNKMIAPSFFEKVLKKIEIEVSRVLKKSP